MSKFSRSTIAKQKALVEGGLQAGVKWFIPSEFASDITHAFYASLSFVASKVATMEVLEKNESRIAHTLITRGTFLDWGLNNGVLGFDIANRTVMLYDDGKSFFSSTPLRHSPPS